MERYPARSSFCKAVRLCRVTKRIGAFAQEQLDAECKQSGAADPLGRNAVCGSDALLPASVSCIASSEGHFLKFDVAAARPTPDAIEWQSTARLCRCYADRPHDARKRRKHHLATGDAGVGPTD